MGVAAVAALLLAAEAAPVLKKHHKKHCTYVQCHSLICVGDHSDLFMRMVSSR